MPNYINFLPKKFLFLHFYGYNHRMKYVSLTEFFSDNINLFINVIASLFALFFCFSVGFGLLFFITLPLGYIMGIVLSFPLLIFVFLVFAALDICICILASVCRVFK
jgi:hypothetical protein